MNIFIFFGDDIISSRKAFLFELDGLREKGYEITKIPGKELNEEFLENSLGAKTLFGEKRALAIEGFLSLTKSKDKEKIFEKISSFKDTEAVLAFWESKEFSKADQQKYPKEYVFKNFKLPGSLFTFLDSLKKNQKKSNIENFRIVTEAVDEFFLFSMLVRQVRLLILTKEKALGSVPSWQKAKLEKQASEFELEGFLYLYKKMLDMDYRQKTSQTPFSFKASLELLISEI